MFYLVCEMVHIKDSLLLKKLKKTLPCKVPGVECHSILSNFNSARARNAGVVLPDWNEHQVSSLGLRWRRDGDHDGRVEAELRLEQFEKYDRADRQQIVGLLVHVPQAAEYGVIDFHYLNRKKQRNVCQIHSIQLIMDIRARLWQFCV